MTAPSNPWLEAERRRARAEAIGGGRAAGRQAAEGGDVD